MKDFLLNQSSAVRTPVLPIVRQVLNTVKTDYDGVSKYETNIVQWLKPVADLDDFYVYPMNGITEGLNWWYNQETRGVYMDDGDYQWIQPRGNLYDEAVKYQSIPSSATGNFVTAHSAAASVLDLAYVGSTRKQAIDINSNVETVFYSLSKSFGVRNIRTGWIFTRKPDPRLEALVHNAKYYNYYAHNVAEAIISNFEIDFVHKTLYNKQIEACEQLDLQPSDSVWLATTSNDDYAKFRRSGTVARVCLAGVYEL